MPHHLKSVGILAIATVAFAFCPNGAAAQCALPFKITNGQTPDATQMMANFNALVGCLNVGGSANAIQYNAGSGSLGGAGPLTDGQLVVGSTGGAPQAQMLTAGSGIAITNGSGSVTIATTTSTAGTGLYRQVMSATPTSANTGLTTWLNQRTSVVADSAVGMSIDAPQSASTKLTGRYMTAPSTPYPITALVSATRNSAVASAVGIGWYDGTAKLHVLSNIVPNANFWPLLQVAKYASVTGLAGTDFVSTQTNFSLPIWFQLRDDGTNVSFAFSQDGANFLTVFSVAKSSGYLGASGYSNVIFFVNPQSTGDTIGTILSSAQS